MKHKKFLILFTFFILISFILSIFFVSCRTFRDDIFSDDKESERKIELEKIEPEKIEEVEEKIYVKLWIDEDIPEYLKAVISQEARRSFDEVEYVTRYDNFDIRVEIIAPDKSTEIFWVLAPVVPFFTYNDDMYTDDFKAFWEGEENSLDYITNDNLEPFFIVSEDVLKVMERVWGSFKSESIKIAGGEDISSSVENIENSFSVVPFEEIRKEYKVLDIDGMSIFDKDLDILKWPLTFGIKISGEDSNLVNDLKHNLESIIATNRDMENLAAVNMTGVTAIVRQIARRIERYGVLSPGEEIAETLRDADITHISNEIPFVEGCTTDTRPQGLVFCSSAENIELLRYVGTDVIELTGNHQIDRGHEWFNYTLDMYDEEGWPYFGGGRNLEDSYKPATFDVNGNRIAFIGANTFGPTYNWATEDTPGSARINMWDQLEKEEDMIVFEEIVKDLKKQGYIVIFTFQHEETYRYYPTETQITDFRRMIDAGADIVSGSQSHHPMGVEFWEDGFINYGLGNLFFGQQLAVLGNNPGIIARHIFYKGKHINTILITTMLNDFSQPRITTSEERLKELKSIFDASIK